MVGPKFDVKVRLEVDDEGELIREVFMEEYIPHVPGRYGRKGNVMCITVPVEERDKKFILGSGSGHDLIAARKVERMDLTTYQDDAVNFHIQQMELLYPPASSTWTSRHSRKLPMSMYLKTLHQSFPWGSDAWIMGTPLFGLVEKIHISWTRTLISSR